MEVTGVVVRQVMSFYGTGVDARVASSSPCPSGLLFDHASRRFPGVGLGNYRVNSQRPRSFAALLSSGFADSGHLEYYVSAKKKAKEMSCEIKIVKKNLKVIKRLSRDMSMVSDMSGNSLMDEEMGKMISEAMEFLLEQLQVMRTEQKELKRKKKGELMKLKCKLDSSSSSSSSESSDNDCRKVINTTSLTTTISASKQSKDNKSEQAVEEATLDPSSPQMEEVISEEVAANGEPNLQITREERRNETASSSNSCNSVAVRASSDQKVEVCIGGKCKKLGAVAILEEFEKEIGEQGAIVGCKCMGKCKNGPNVKLKNHPDGNQAERKQGASQFQTNPLYLGVTLEDVTEIVATLLGKDSKDNGMLPAA